MRELDDPIALAFAGAPQSALRARAILILIVLFMVINFADKAVMGLSAVFMSAELHISNAQFGAIGSAFFLLFSLSSAVVGILSNRLPSKAVIAVMAFIWAAAQLPMIAQVSLDTLIVSRIVLGAGEGPAFPVALHAIYKWYPDGHRALPTSLISIGSSLGIAVLSPLLTWIIVKYSWHVAFGLLGVIGFVWLALWLVVAREGPGDAVPQAPTPGTHRVPYGTILSSRTFIGVTLAGFAGYWAVAVGIIWVPSFFIKAIGYSAITTGWVVAIPPLLQIALAPLVGFFSQHLEQRGVSRRLSRGALTAGPVVVAGGAMMLLSGSSGLIAPVPLAAIALGFCGLTYAIGPTLIGEIVPAQQRGAILGISGGLYTTTGLIAPWLIGHVVDQAPSAAAGFRNGFFYSGILIASCAAVALVLINPKHDLG
ncbi:MAG: MFS transporter, partial [Alphaproteobacteria bacterium]|nr:MFS transporter [Alphaproteobacteria bacterium]